jgi:hypothetical protein
MYFGSVLWCFCFVAYLPPFLPRHWRLKRCLEMVVHKIIIDKGNSTLSNSATKI